MRDYLKFDEIIDILEDYLSDDDLCCAQRDVLKAANTCLCAAKSVNECCCGAWDDDYEY